MKITGDTECPGCKKTHKATFDIDKLTTPESPTLENVQVTGQATQQMEKPKEPEKIIETKTISPSDKPFFVCANGNCGEGVHRNDNYSKKPNKKCKNCNSLNGEKKCTNCGNKDTEEFDELEDDELTELGIPLPVENHEGHNHE